MRSRRQGPARGYMYLEVLLSAVLLAVLLVPALQALQTGVGGGPSPGMAARSPALAAKMEEVLSNPFALLYAHTYAGGGNSDNAVKAALSDAVGATDRRVVVTYRYDASSGALSGSDTGLLQVRVYYEADGSAAALRTLAGRWW